MSLLTLISGEDEGAAALCGLTPPTTIIGSQDPNVPLLLRLAQQEGRELARRHNWQALKVDYTFASLAAEAQTAFPAAFDRLLPYPELWNRTTTQRYAGPTDDVTWGRIKGTGIASATPGWWRLIGNVLTITPAPSAGQTLALPYMTKNWVRPLGGTGSTDKAAFTLDNDTVLLSESLMTLGVVWRWKKSKGFDYAEDMATYERAVELAASRDRGLGVIAPRSGGNGLPEASWIGTVTP